MSAEPSIPSIPLGNVDIWLEILKFFEPALESDSEAEIQEKRMTALAIALLCPGLTEFGLDTLWKSMSTLQPIVRAINTSSLNRFISYPLESGCWVLRRPLISSDQRERIRSYRARIQNFHAREMTEKEVTLWPALATCLDIKTLLPNLRFLSLVYNPMVPFASWLSVSPLLSPTLSSFSLFASSSKIAEILIVLLQTRSVQPTRIVYRGPSSKRLAQSFMHHVALECLRFDFGDHPPGSSTSIIHLFGKLTHLRELRVDLRVFTINKVEERALTLANLRYLDITGSPLSLCRLLQSTNFPSLISLKLNSILEDLGGECWDSLCICIAASAPMLRHLSLQDLSSIAEITVQALSRLSKLDLLSLELSHIPENLMSSDSDGITPLWPNLRVLSILADSPESFIDASAFLTPLAHRSGLQRIELPLDFRGLDTPISRATPLILHSPLTEIVCTRSKGVPTTVAGTLILVKNLLRCFPNLKRIWEKEGNGNGGKLVDLQLGVDVARELLVDYLCRTTNSECI
ncbi:hypothetical protein P691DRAFT_805320 [Macrolepiota fuliginosa MF-IS2]|uniref:F-box domain-containing protein n=1 Tax=Macrolepiota fuliginosa MF-IS2 TaxID=1400762 RepID=A0A9P6BYZ4_9AGAR|nr:hypothetical protein P691DRAFT_805320 [Macrolepiota fuliginosa MF-IS2]